MSPVAEVPELSLAEAREILIKLGALADEIVLVGGQALAFWADYFGDRVQLHGAINSKDIDFGGTREAVVQAAVCLGGTYLLPEPFAITPNTGIVEFVASGGQRRRIDFLGDVFGVELGEVFEMALTVEMPGTGASFRVMHPVHCLEARISNVGGLPGYRGPHGLAQAHAAIGCAREYLRLRLAEGAVRTVLDLNERIYRFAYSKLNARTTFIDHGIDTFEAVLVSDDLPEAFVRRRYPQMQANLARRRASWRGPP